MCQQAAVLARGAADLHTHTTASDGDLTPSQLVVRARLAGFSAVAITDHDTFAGVAEAVETAWVFDGRPISVVPGVEVSTEHGGREYHVLGYFADPAHPGLAAALAQVRTKRGERFRRFLELLGEHGVAIPPHLTDAVTALSPSLGRRHVANLIVRSGHAATRVDAFRRFIDSIRQDVGINHRVPLAHAVRLIAAAGGVSSLAHPPAELTEPELAALADLGLAAVETIFPAAGAGRSAELRGWADKLGLLPTGGSDYHGPDGPRNLGTPALPYPDYRRLAEFAGRAVSAGAVTFVGPARRPG
jgi:predicted metal-dependent phosphoesterase TrpH